jgi:hypothetical protein
MIAACIEFITIPAGLKRSLESFLKFKIKDLKAKFQRGINFGCIARETNEVSAVCDLNIGRTSGALRQGKIRRRDKVLHCISIPLVGARNDPVYQARSEYLCLILS